MCVITWWYTTQLRLMLFVWRPMKLGGAMQQVPTPMLTFPAIYPSPPSHPSSPSHPSPPSQVLAKDVIPHTRHVRGSNFCFMNVFEVGLP